MVKITKRESEILLTALMQYSEYREEDHPSKARDEDIAIADALIQKIRKLKR